MAKAAQKMLRRRDQRRAQFDTLRKDSALGCRRPGSLKKKGKSASTNRANKRRTR